MAKGFKKGAYYPLNFKVVCNPKPETAKENTIWVDTDRINNYYFSATQPENMVEYDVWFPVGKSSTVAFSATEKNPIMVYPLSAKQYIGGALENVDAMSYQGGEWVDWAKYLYNHGDECTELTGGWTSRAWLSASGRTAKAPTVTKNADDIYATISGRYCEGAVLTTKKIDLTNYKTITFDGNATGSIHLCLWKDITGYAIAVASAYTNAASNKSLDISNISGEHFVGFHFNTVENNTTNITIERLFLK